MQSDDDDDGDDDDDDDDEARTAKQLHRTPKMRGGSGAQISPDEANSTPQMPRLPSNPLSFKYSPRYNPNIPEQGQACICAAMCCGSSFGRLEVSAAASAIPKPFEAPW